MINRMLFGLLLAALFGFISCAKSQNISTEDTLDRVRRTGVIDACYVVFPPDMIKNPKTGALSGQDYDTLNTIAQKINAKVNWQETSYNNMIADVQSGRCDVFPQTVFGNISRSMTVAFTQPPNVYSGEGAIVRKNDVRFKKVQDPMSFDKPDIVVVVAAGESGDVWVKEHFKKAIVKRIETASSNLNSFMVEVSAGRADVGITNAVVTALYAGRHPEVIDVLFGIAPTGWVVRQNDFKWLHFLETALQFLDTQGTIVQLEKKYNVPWMHLVKQYKLQ